MTGLLYQSLKSIFLPEIRSHTDGLHVHQVLNLFHPLMSHAGTLCDQLFIILDLCLASLTADQKPVGLSSLIGELDVKAKVPVIRLFEINLAHIISSGRNQLIFHRVMAFILYPEGRPAFRRFSQNPSV